MTIYNLNNGSHLDNLKQFASELGGIGFKLNANNVEVDIEERINSLRERLLSEEAAVQRDIGAYNESLKLLNSFVSDEEISANNEEISALKDKILILGNCSQNIQGMITKLNKYHGIFLRTKYPEELHFKTEGVGLFSLPQVLFLSILGVNDGNGKLIISNHVPACRLVCKAWKELIDQEILKGHKRFIEDVKKHGDEIPRALGIRDLVIIFADEVNPEKNEITSGIEVKKFLELSYRLKRLIGSEATSRQVVINSVEQIQNLTRNDKTNLHILWNAIKKIRSSLPDLGTCEEISQYMMKGHSYMFISIERLSLRDSGLTAIPKEIENLSRLKILDLSNNQIRSLEGVNFPELVVLHLSNNQIRSFGKVEWPNLKSLDSPSNQLEDLKEVSFPGLQRLDLSHNLIKNAEILNKYSSLSSANLSHNQIESIKEGLSLVYLRTLDLSHNKIESIKEEMMKLPQLQELYLNDNQLRSFGELRYCKALTTCVIDNNPLEAV